MRRATFVLVAALVFSGSALAAIAPHLWTPSQASSAIRVYADDLDLLSVTCRGTGKRVQGRYVSFRCVATFEGETLSDPSVRGVLLAKTRRAGGICFSRTVVPSGCLAPGKRARGSLTDVSRAVYAKYGPPAQSFAVQPHGAGFYSWTWVSGDTTHRGTVTFAPRPVLRVLV